MMLLAWVLYGAAAYWGRHLGPWYWDGFLLLGGLQVLQWCAPTPWMPPVGTRGPVLVVLAWWYHGATATRGVVYWIVFGALLGFWIVTEQAMLLNERYKLVH